MPAQQDSTTERPRPITVVIVDDEQMIRGALAQTLTGGGLDLVGEATNAQEPSGWSSTCAPTSC